MSKAALIERVAKKGKLSKAAAGRTVALVLGEMEAGLKACNELPEQAPPKATGTTT